MNQITLFYDNFKKTPLFKLISRLSILILLFLIFSVSTFNFLSPDNLITITLQVAIYAVIASGMSFILIVGATDLSAGSIVGLSGIICAILLRDYGFSMAAAILIGLIIGILCGIFNGITCTYLRLLPFIATLGTMWVFRGLTQLLANGQPVTIRNENHPEVAEIFRFIGSGRIGGIIPVAVIVALLVAIVLSIILNKTVLGRNIFATGSNTEAARLSGINVRKTTILAFIVGGVTCGLAGIMVTARLTSGQVNAGTGYELEAIAACVIGGVSLAGGEGTVVGAVIGALIMAMLRNGLNLNGVNSFWQQIIIGLILIIAVAFDTFQRRKTS